MHRMETMLNKECGSHSRKYNVVFMLHSSAVVHLVKRASVWHAGYQGSSSAQDRHMSSKQVMIVPLSNTRQVLMSRVLGNDGNECHVSQ